MKLHNISAQRSLFLSFFFYQVNIEWKKDSKQFHLTFGSQGQSTTINPHVVMATQIQQELNETRSLPHLVQVGDEQCHKKTCLQGF